MLAASSVLRLPRAEPMFWKASLLGAKMVMFGVLLTVSNKSVALMAPRRATRSAAERVSAVFSGRVRTLSMMWITPPVKLTSCVC